MAILQGFPPSNTLSPGIRISEKDLSYVTAQQSFHRAGLVGFASKGPINQPTLISSIRQLTATFGNPHPESGDPYMIYAAKQYLLVASELFVVRVADNDPVSDEQATTASVDVPAAGEVVKVESDTAGPYDIDNDMFFRWKLNGVLSPKTLVVLTGSGKTTTDLVDELNEQLDFENDGIEFYANGSDALSVKSLWSFGPLATIEFISVQDSLYGPNSPVGLGTGMTPASVTGTLALYPSNNSNGAGHFDFTGLTDMNLQIVLDGSDLAAIDGVVQEIDLSSFTVDTEIADIVTEINDQIATLPGGFVCSAVSNNLKFSTLHAGSDARLRVKPDSTAYEIFGLPTTTAKGDSPSGASDDVDVETFGKTSGLANTDNSKSFTVWADSPGIEGASTSVNIFNDVRQNHFIIEVTSNGNPVETWGNLTKNTASSYYVQTYISLVSDYIRVVDDTDEGAGPANGSYALVGGSDGIPADPEDQDALLLGSSVGSTGLYALGDTEQIDIDLVAIPGHASTSVVQGLLTFCQSTRQDCFALIDPPFGLTVSEIVSWQNGTHPLNNEKLDSDFGALYWPWVKLRDTVNGLDMWCPPSGSMMAVMARNDFLAAPWFAPAGLTRGQVPGVTDVYNRPTLEERDQMYGNRNCVNPIVSFSDASGFVVWGQKTLQRAPTALDRVNVRRMMFYVEKSIRAACRVLLFEPNDSAFQSRFTQICSAILDNVKSGRGLYAYIIKADSDLNTPDVIDRNEFRAQIGIQPTKSVEFMFIEFSIHRTGSDFSDIGSF